jgi:hypothetical protein
MLELYGTPANWEAIADDYFEVFEDVPADLVRLAFKRLRASPRDYLPKPGLIRSHIVDDLLNRRRMLAKLQLALTRRRDPEPERQPPSEKEKAAVDRLLASATAARAMPKERSDASGPMTAADRQRVRDELAGFKLPDADDPRVVAALRKMGVDS